jgi:hypothetical protein
MPVSSIPIAPIIATTPAPSSAVLPGTAQSAALAKPAGGLEPDFQSVLSGQTPPSAPASGPYTPGTLASAQAIERTVAPPAASQAFVGATAAPASSPKAQVAVAAAPTSPATKGSPTKTASAYPQSGTAPPSGAPVPPPAPAFPPAADVAAAAGVAVPPSLGTVESIVAPSRPLPSAPATTPLAAPSLPTGPVIGSPAVASVGPLGVSDALPGDASAAPAVTGAATPGPNPVASAALVPQVAFSAQSPSGPLAAVAYAAAAVPGTLASIAATPFPNPVAGAALVPQAAVSAQSPSGPLAAAAFAAVALPGTLASIAATPLMNRQAPAAPAPGAAPSAPAAAMANAVQIQSPVVGASAVAPLPASLAPVVPGSLAALAPASPATGFRAQTGSGEKFAESASTPGTASVGTSSRSNKQSLDINGETVTNPMEPIGTSVASPTLAMTPSATVQAAIAAPAGSAQALSTPAGENTPPVVALASASEAVESVLQIADLQAAQAQAAQASVNLHFTVGGENLSVRVALQEGQVHTQFTTDSNDLRTALAHEWVALGSTSTGSVRFAEPVFTSGNRGDPKAGGDLAGDSGQQANRGRDQSPAGEGSQPSAKPPRSTPAAVAANPGSAGSAEPLVLGRLNSFA